VISVIAEIKGKISSDGSNLSERLEDQLTSNIFGTLRYIPAEKGLLHILKRIKFFSQIEQNKWFAFLSSIQPNADSCDYNFWVKGQKSEIDLIIEFCKVTIGFEVKYRSALSSADQLEREAFDLLISNKLKEKFLILLGVEPEVNFIAAITNNEKKLPHQINFGYLSWQDILLSLIEIHKNISLNEFEKLMVKDMIALLRKKKLERFTSFGELGNPVVKKNGFFYLENDNYFFKLCEEILVTKGLHYEFR
jgi:hypothetical protein